MLFLLSPAKTLDYHTPPPPALAHLAPTAPLFVKQSKQLIDLLRNYSVAQIASLMDLSDPLAALNVARYKAWSSRATDKNARPAVLAFDGDVYGGLDARSLAPEDLAWAQAHVCVLSGLYGVLRPLDRMQAYRLEMGTRLPNPQGSNLYQYWADTVTPYLNRRLRTEPSRVLVNCASQEYFKVVQTRALKARVVECVFQQFHSGSYKLISFPAKRARGLMARFAATQRLVHPEQLRAFDLEGYRWVAAASTPERLVFRQKI